jgi:hypothetical protein
MATSRMDVSFVRRQATRRRSRRPSLSLPYGVRSSRRRSGCSTSSRISPFREIGQRRCAPPLRRPWHPCRPLGQ